MKDEVLQLMMSAKSLSEPENLFSGLRLPENFQLPDNILMFFHNYTAPAPNAHGRCTLVFPFDEMIYYVDRKQFFLEPGVALFVPPYAMRFLHLNSSGYRRLFITFDAPQNPQAYLPEAGAYRLENPIWEYLKQFIASYQAGMTEDSSVQLMHFLRELCHVSGEKGKQSLNKYLAKTVSYIEYNIGQSIGLVELAEHVGLSESHLRMLFRKEMGISLGHYIAKKRLDTAKYRLLHSNMKLSEIATGCGFANLFVFSAFFKKQVGISPLRYRKNAKNATSSQK